MSYCDDCIHEKVCRFTKEITKCDSAPVKFLSNYTRGPTIRYAVDCPYKMIKQPSGSYFGEVPRS